MTTAEIVIALVVGNLLIPCVVWLVLEVRYRLHNRRWRQRMRRENREFMQHIRAGDWEWVMNRLDEGAKK